MGMRDHQILDTFGVPEYVATHIGAVEDAGFGLIRIIRCIERNHVLIPVVSIVIPAMSVLEGSTMVYDLAQQMACRGVSCRN